MIEINGRVIVGNELAKVVMIDEENGQVEVLYDDGSYQVVNISKVKKEIK